MFTYVLRLGACCFRLIPSCDGLLCVLLALSVWSLRSAIPTVWPAQTADMCGAVRRRSPFPSFASSSWFCNDLISGKIVTLPGDADFPNTNTRPTNSTLYPGDSAGAGAAGMQGQAPHPVFDQCSCTQCRESRSTSTSRTAGGDGGGGAAATAASSAMRQARENTSTMTLVDLPEPLLVLICKDLGYVCEHLNVRACVRVGV